MARQTKEVINSLKNNVAEQDESIDATKGPIYNFMISPVAPEISANEQMSERLERLLSLDIVSAEDSDVDITAFGNNFKVARGGGKKEQHLQTFYLYNKPTETISIPTGTLVSTENGTYVYKVIEGRSFYQENSETYFNSNTNRYELNLLVEAVDFGSEYNLPKGRVSKLVSSDIKVDGTVSATSSLVLGTEEEDNLSYMKKVEQKFEGINSGTLSGIAYQVNNLIGISDVTFAKPGDDIFSRKVKRAALDIYVNGTNLSCKILTKTIVEETDKIYFDEAPVVSVDYVLVNQEETEYILNIDNSNDFGGSTKAKDYIAFPNKLEAGSYVEIKYYINQDVVSASELFEENDLYDTDFLFRKPKSVMLNLEVAIKVNTVNKSSAQSQALDALANYPKYTMGEILYPSNIEPLMRTSVPNVVAVYVIKHNIDGQPFEIGTVALDKNQIIDLSNAKIKVI